MFKLGALTISLADLSEFDFSNLENAVVVDRARRSVGQELDITEKCLVRCGQHIQAIKAYRARTGSGLREAKDACDAFRATVPGWTVSASYDEATGTWRAPSRIW